jgi:hypothetical protein
MPGHCTLEQDSVQQPFNLFLGVLMKMVYFSLWQEGNGRQAGVQSTNLWRDNFLCARSGMPHLTKPNSLVMFPKRAQFNPQICQADPLTHFLFIFFPVCPTQMPWNQDQVILFIACLPTSTVLNITHLNLLLAVWVRDYYHSHLTDEETEAQSGWELFRSPEVFINALVLVDVTHSSWILHQFS